MDMERSYMLLSQSPPKYRDRLFRILGSLVAAHFITVFGDEDSIFEMFLSLNYYVALSCGFVIAFCVSYTVYYATTMLDRQYDWFRQPLNRAILQVLAGWLAPSVVAFLFAALYFAFFGYNILNTLYIRIDFPVIVLLILLLNVYYLCYYFFLRWQEFRASAQSQPANKKIVIINTPIKSIPIRMEHVCYVYIIKGNTFVRTFDMPSPQDAYMVNETLKDMEAFLDMEMFFRTNRQMLINFSAVQSFRQGKYQTLELTITPPLFEGKDKDMPEDIRRLHTVTEERVAGFKKWMDR